MARSSNQKAKLLYLAKIFSEQTDETHGLTMPELISRLNDVGISADRKTIYTDLEELRHFGMDILAQQEGGVWRYCLVSREFELAELKLLVDSVQSSRFITEKKSRSLIKKLESLVSVYDARQLQRQVLIAGRVKTMNESIYYNIDKLHSAINSNLQIRFQYYQWNVKKEMELRHGGAWYQVSPWCLIWDDEKYYLVAYDAADGIIKHYRVDKMLHISPTPAFRDGQAQFRDFDLAKYAKGLFGMFGGEETDVLLEGENAMVGVLIDRFGKDIAIAQKDDAHFEARVTVAISPQFFGWVMALGRGIRIAGPAPVVKRMREEAARLAQQYEV